MCEITLGRKLGALALAVALLLASLGVGPAWAADSYDPQHTMLALNMAVVSVHKILATQDRIVLNQEYDNIINNLSLGNIESDLDLTSLYQDLMNAISKKRLRGEEARRFQARYDQQAQRRFTMALSKVGASGGGILNILGDLMLTCVSTYFSYPSAGAELREGLDDALWRLKREELEDCNALQTKLLQSSWNLLRQYRLPDEYRLVQKALDEFHRAVNEPDAGKRLRMLRALEGEFRVYPSYWFYRARAARDAGELEEVRKSLDAFDKVWRPVLRRDPYRLEASKFRIHDLLRGEGALADEVRKEVLGHLEVMRENTSRDDWANNLFAGTVYLALGDRGKAIDCVALNTDFGYEKEISEALLAQIKQDKPDSVVIQDALRTLRLNELVSGMQEKDKAVALALADYFDEREGAVEALKRLGAETENPVVFHVLRLNEQRRGISSNYSRIVEWFEREASLRDKSDAAYTIILTLMERYVKAKNLLAQLLLAEMYQYGWGVEKNEEQAEKLYSALAQAGEIYAQFTIIQLRLLEKQAKRGATSLRDKREENGGTTTSKPDAEALFKIGYDHYYGQNNTAKDLKIAAKFFQQAANKGHVQAQFYLGWSYEYGYGVEQNFRKAEEYYQKAADQGDQRAKEAIISLRIKLAMSSGGT